MVPPKVWKLLETVDCNDVYEFLGMDRDASLGDLRKAAEKKYASIHNQSSRTDWARAGTTLAGLCKSAIFKDARSKNAYDRESAKRGSNRHEGTGSRREQPRKARSRQAEEAVRRQAEEARRWERQQARHRKAEDARGREAEDARRRKAQQVRHREATKKAKRKAASAARYVVKHSESISAIGVILILLGAALGRGFGAVLMLGQVAFMCGFTALLHKTSLRQSMVVGAAGISLVVAGIVAQSTPDFPSGWPLNLMHGLRQLGGMALLCGFVSFGYRKAWHLNAIGTARSIAEWWMAKTARWNRLVALGVTAMALSLPVGLAGGIVSILFGSAGIFYMLSTGLLYGGMLSFGAGLLWLYQARKSQVVECQDCRIQLARRKFQQGRFEHVCPRCYSRQRPLEIRTYR